MSDWNEWSKYVLKELERLNTCYSSLDDKHESMLVEIIKLKVKAGVWGAAAGAIPVIVGLLIFFFKKAS